MEAWSRWRGSANNDRRWWPWALVSVLLHVPFTPLLGVLGLLGWLLNQEPDIPEGPPITAIPIDIIEEPAEEPAPPAAAPPPEPVAAPAPEGPKPAAPKPPPKPSAQTAPSAAPSTPPPVPSGSAAPSEPGAKIGDPVAMSGGAQRVVDPNANVRLIIDTEKLRSHPLGPRVGSILSRVHQWRDFMGPAALDPVRDIDRVLIVGPQLRRTGDVVAVIQHHHGQDNMHAAIDGLVQRDRSGGEWLPDSKVPVARASADRAERYFVLPSDRVVVVTPKSALAAAEKLGKARLPALPGSQVATAYVATPHRAFIGMPVRVPQSILWARARVVPLENGGAQVDIEAEDQSPEQAAANAAELERQISAATQLDLGVLGALLGARPTRFVERIQFRAEGKKILGELVLTQKQILQIFDFAEVLFVPPAARPQREPTSGPAGTSSGPVRVPSVPAQPTAPKSPEPSAPRLP